MSQVVWNESAFDKLILEEKKRKMISLLVKSHRIDDAAFDDIVSGKGKGLVGLLSGSPGVGKTLTAEVVAELSNRPLYVVCISTDIPRRAVPCATDF
jgi:MoxR-like ATPase